MPPVGWMPDGGSGSQLSPTASSPADAARRLTLWQSLLDCLGRNLLHEMWHFTILRAIRVRGPVRWLVVGGDCATMKTQHTADRPHASRNSSPSSASPPETRFLSLSERSSMLMCGDPVLRQLVHPLRRRIAHAETERKAHVGLLTLSDSLTSVVASPRYWTRATLQLAWRRPETVRVVRARDRRVETVMVSEQ